MVWLVVAGALVSALGMGLLAWCIRSAARLKKAEGLTDEAAQAAFGKLVLLNTAGLGTGFLGLAMVAAGIILS